jgi:DNA-binding transcriptional LysR family regulator
MQESVSLADLASFPWLIASFPATHWRTISRVFLDAGMPPPEPAMEVSTVVFFASLVSQSDMLAIMPQSILGTPQGAGLVTLPITFPFPSEVIAIAYRENARLLPGAKIVVQRIKDICSELPGGTA